MISGSPAESISQGLPLFQTGKSLHTIRNAKGVPMRKIQCGLIIMALFCTLAQAFNVTTYNQTWTSQSADVTGSMPIGNGETGCNVWVQNNVIHFLIGRTDAWNDANDNGWVESMLPKLAKIDVTITPNPFSSGFSQVLKLKEGEIEIIGGTGVSQKDIIMYVDANASVVRIEGHGIQAFTMAVSVDQSYGTAVSRTVSVSNNAVVFYHRNPSSSYIWNQTTSTQKVDKTHFTDPMSNRTFGGIMQGSGFTASGSTVTSANDTVAVCEIFTHTSLAASVAAWTTDIQNIVAAAHTTSVSQARAAHEKWWANFWGRSWIELDNTQTETTKNYLLQRFVNACEGRGAYPAKFNGSLFNFTDNRTWGGTYWMQNTRLMFWLNLAAGDFDLMNPFFKMYTDMIPIRKEATKALFNHDGMNVPETVHFFGLWANSDYGDGINTISGWVGLHYNGSLELLAMMLDYYDFTKDNTFATQKLIPYAREVLRFWDVHWQRANGKLNIIANALETYRKVTNPSCDLAGLQWDLDKLVKYPSSIVPDSLKTTWTRLRGEVADLPTYNDNGTMRLMYYEGATPSAVTANSENPELYAIFPYRIFGVSKPNMALALNSFNKRKFSQTHDWSQDAVQAAYLGQSDIAMQFVTNYLKSGTVRFPAFFSGVDGLPEMNSGNVSSLALQCMLLQADNDTIQLFPAWNKTWNVDFRLHGPDNTVVEGTLNQGTLTRLAVGPVSKKNNIKLLNGITFDMSKVVALDSASTALIETRSVPKQQKMTITAMGKFVQFSLPGIPASLEITDASGKLVKQIVNCTGSNLVWNKAGVRSGCYLVKAKMKQGVVTGKLVLAK